MNLLKLNYGKSVVHTLLKATSLLELKTPGLLPLAAMPRFYAAKKPVELTEEQKQAKKYSAELGFKEMTTFKGTKYESHDVETSILYMKSEG
jgi:hypothetical protein